MRRLVLLLSIILPLSSARAQIVRPRFGISQPGAYVSLGAGYMQGWTVQDGTKNQIWSFGDATQFIASLEKSLSGGASLGVTGTTALVPLHINGAFNTSEENANVSQAFATFHYSNPGSFHTVVEGKAGATLYSNFQRTDGGASSLHPGSDTDFSFSFGYGFGYSFTPRFSVDVVQDITTSVHQSDGLQAGSETSARIHTTRLVGRFGLGGK